MTGIPSFQAAEFETSLINELKRLGTLVIPQFRVPGTHTRVDLYIASPVRAFVEIKLRESPILYDVKRGLSQLEHLRREFGGEIVPILVVGGEPWHSSPNTQELRDSGFFILSLNNSTPDVSPATYCAKEIRNFLMHLPYHFEGIEVPAAKPSAPPPRPAPSDIHFLQDIDPSIADSISRGTNFAASQRIESHFVESTNMELRYSPLSPMQANLQGKLLSAPDIFFDVLVSLKSVLVAEQFAILEQELSAFSEEYRHGHYTACALRIGRTLEHVVYALARGWGVNVNRATLQSLSDLRNSFDQLSGAVIAYSTTDENERTKRRKAVETQLLEIQKKLMQLHSDIHSDNLHPKNTDIPINIESILRDIEKQFGRYKKVLNAINDIKDKKILRKIISARNNAAHASTSGVRRELSKSDVDEVVELLRTALFILSNAAFAVAGKDNAAND